MMSFEDMWVADATELLREATKVPASTLKEGAKGTAYDFLLNGAKAVCEQGKTPELLLFQIAYDLTAPEETLSLKRVAEVLAAKADPEKVAAHQHRLRRDKERKESSQNMLE